MNSEGRGGGFAALIMMPGPSELTAMRQAVPIKRRNTEKDKVGKTIIEPQNVAKMPY